MLEHGTMIAHGSPDLVERYGQGRFAPAAGTPEHLKYRYWLHFAEGSAMPPLLMKLVFERIKQTKMPFFIKPIARGIADKVLGALAFVAVWAVYGDVSLAGAVGLGLALGWLAGRPGLDRYRI